MAGLARRRQAADRDSEINGQQATANVAGLIAQLAYIKKRLADIQTWISGGALSVFMTTSRRDGKLVGRFATLNWT